jgi:uncharacterized protein (TIGR00369 family)
MNERARSHSRADADSGPSRRRNGPPEAGPRSHPTESDGSAPRSPQTFDVPQVPFLDHLGVRSIDVGPGRCRVELVVSRRHLRTLGIVQGGVILTLLDAAMGLAAGTLAPAGQGVVTIQLDSHFIRPVGEAETLVATGELKHSGRQIAVACGDVHTAGGVLVACGSATFMHRPHVGASPGRPCPGDAILDDRSHRRGDDAFAPRIPIRKRRK